MSTGHDEARDLLADLNEPQRQAVTHRDGPLLVLAGPGSGKTRVITHRAAYLVRTGVAPGGILAITFTNKAADEMRQRIAALGAARGMWVYTFHAFCARILRELGPLAGVGPGYSIFDEADQLRTIKEAMQACQIDPHFLRPEFAQAVISRSKNELQSPETFARQAESADYRMIARVYEEYDRRLRTQNAVDFDDLLLRVALVLRDQPPIAEHFGWRFGYILIDEYQDTNRAQYLIARRLAEQHHNLCATGDPDQSIYAWRGADINNILDFEHDYPDARIIRLEQNYRSTQNILEAAGGLIRVNRARKDKELWTENERGERVCVADLPTSDDEAEHVAALIAQLIGEGRAAGDMAILYRVNAVSRGLEDALRRRMIPYKIIRGVEFYRRQEVRDLLAYLRILVNPADEAALLRIINTPPRGIGDSTVERLRRAATESGRPMLDVCRRAESVASLGAKAIEHVRGFVALLDSLAPLTTGAVDRAVAEVLSHSGLEKALRAEQETGGEDRLANAEELVAAAARYAQSTDQPTLAGFLTQIALVSDQDALKEGTGCVLLMTLHAAKGLEFPVVFLVGLEEGLLPHDRALKEGGRELEEERRLCFVGMTRAQQRLYLTYAHLRFIGGSRVPRSASRFLNELPAGCLEESSFAPPSTDRATTMVDDEASQAVIATRRPRSRRRRGGFDHDDERTFSPDDPTTSRVPPPPESKFADWSAGMLVEHAQFGVGQVQWIQHGGGQTRASIRFAGYGQKTLILEFAPVQKLERPPR
jgi:DNA helicase-2/ATP-dependent DNA helicase PcrA